MDGGEAIEKNLQKRRRESRENFHRWDALWLRHQCIQHSPNKVVKLNLKLWTRPCLFISKASLVDFRSTIIMRRVQMHDCTLIK